MKHVFGISALVLAVSSAGCATTQVTGIPADVVIDKLKEQLGQVQPLDVSYKAEAGCQPSGDYRIVTVPTKAQVQLKTVLTNSITVGLGGKFGTPIVATPSVSHVSTSVKTSQMTMNFCVMPETLMGAQSPTPNGDCLWTLADPKKPYADTLWPTKKRSLNLDLQSHEQHNKVVSIAAKDQPSDPNLADMLQSAVAGLIYSSHKDSCLLPQNMDVQLAFQVTAQIDAGLKLDLIVVNFQDTQSSKRDYTHTIDVTFSLAQGSTASLY